MLFPFEPPAALSFQAATGGESGYYTAPRERRLRIAFIAAEDRRTGTYFRYHNLAVALRQIGHRVAVYSQSHANRFGLSRELRDGVPYILSPTVPGSRWVLPPTNPGTIVWRLATLVERADVYHLFQPFPTGAASWLWLKKWRAGLFVYDWDDFWINDEFGLKNPRDLRAWWTAQCVRRLEQRLPALSHLTTTVSHPLAQLARERNCAETAVVYNGVWPRPSQNKQRSRATLNLRQDAFYVGLMGWSGETEWCLEALRRLGKTFRNLRLAVTGRDPFAGTSDYSDVAPRVDYLGVLPDERFAAFNASLDLGLVPMATTEFNRYRLPYKLTDHLGGGTPVLCCRIGEAVRLAEKFDGIYLCEPTLEAWIEAFAETVTRLQGGDVAFSTERLWRDLSWVKIAQDLSATYRAALSSRVVPNL